MDRASRSRYLLPGWAINAFFALGIASSVAIRLLIVFDHLARHLVRPAWYAGVGGYVVFFAYRYAITRRRRRLIREHGLVEKVASGEALEPGDREALGYVVQSVAASRENINYLVIFALSFAAMAADVCLTLADR